MPYRNGPVPGQYDPAYFRREFQRIAEAYDFIEGIGGLEINAADTPIVQTLTGVSVNMNCWVRSTPDAAVSDGPVNCNPQISPVGTIGILQSGVYLVNWFVSLQHDAGEGFAFELYRDGVATGLRATVDTSNQTDASLLSLSAQVVFDQGRIIEVRASSDTGNEEVTYTNATLQVYKMRDLRTRFS